MRTRLAVALMSVLMCVAACDDETASEQPDATSAATESDDDESKASADESADKPKLVEQTDRPEPQQVEGADCEQPAKLTKLADNTVLTAKNGGCYLIEKTLEVNGEDSKLTIEPGVTLKFGENAGLYIHKGALEAKGTADKPITLTGARETPGFWKGVAIRGSNHTDNALHHVTISYAGNDQTFDNAEPAALMLDASRGHNSVDVKDTTLTQSANHGLYAEYDLSGDFTSNTMTKNKEGAARVHARSVRLLDRESTFTGNQKDEVLVWGNTIKSSEHAWRAVGVPYHVTEAIEVRGSAFLKLKPGAELKFDENTGLYIHKAKLNAKGTEDAPITLTGQREVKGFWRGVAMRGSDSIDNVLAHVTIRYAGSDDTYDNVKPAGLMLDASRGANSLKIRNSTFSDNGGYGLYVEHDTEIDFTNNTATGNKSGAARIHPSVVGMLDSNSQYSGNETDRVSVWGANIGGIEATWPAIDVPYHIEEDVELRDDTFITIEPGATFQFAENAGLYVHKGKLKAAGTADKPITFTGAREAAGFWRGIAMRGTSSIDNQFKHVSINFAGSPDNFGNVEPAGLMLDSSRGAVKVSLADFQVTKPGGAALHVEDGITIETDNCANLVADADPRLTEGSADFSKVCKSKEG